MKYVCNWDGNKDSERNTLSSFTVDDCYMHDMSSVFESYGSEVITLTNSTFIKCQGKLYIHIIPKVLLIRQLQYSIVHWLVWIKLRFKERITAVTLFIAIMFLL